MPIYEFRCREHGVFEQRMSMAQAGSEYACPVCNRAAARHYTSPMVARLSKDARATLDRTEKTREQPDVVHHIPNRANNAPTITRNPKHYKLPRQ